VREEGPEVSVVLPVYNERPNLEPLLAEIAAALDRHSYEVVATDDGSTDGSLELLRLLRDRYPVLRVLSLDRHSGQSAAFAAGFAASRGTFVVTMDADGQNDPADVPRLLQAICGNEDVGAIVGYRVRRADGWWRRLQSRVANATRNWITGDRVRDTGCSLKVIRRNALGRLPMFDGMHRFLPTLLRRAGEIVVELEVSHRPRLRGKSSYHMRNRLFTALRDAFGVRWLRHRRLTIRAEEVQGE
jgi:dolichol-phosphate mannosyltransferase